MKQLRHIGIVVSNLEKSLVFYRDLLGLKIQKDNREKGSYIDRLLGLHDTDTRTVKLSSSDGSLIELLHYNCPKSKTKIKKINDIGYSHVAFSVGDLDKDYKYLKNRGVVFNSLPQLSSDGYAKVAFCRDPDGNFIELVEVLSNKSKKMRY